MCANLMDSTTTMTTLRPRSAPPMIDFRIYALIIAVVFLVSGLVVGWRLSQWRAAAAWCTPSRFTWTGGGDNFTNGEGSGG